VSKPLTIYVVQYRCDAKHHAGCPMACSRGAWRSCVQVEKVREVKAKVQLIRLEALEKRLLVATRTLVYTLKEVR
jgi:hypothetical protein